MRRVVMFALLISAISLAPISAVAARPDPEVSVVRATLDNGLRVILLPDDLAPVVSVVVNYLVGADEAPAGFPGMAHAQEHMMFRGNPGLSGSQLALVMAALGGEFDAETGQTVTQYFMSVPSADLSTALTIESIRMQGVLDAQDLWEKERGAIEQEVERDLSNPEYVAVSRIREILFKGSPYARDGLGTISSFKQTDSAALKRFHDAWYAPNNAILIVAGRLEPEKVLVEIKERFGGIPSRSIPPRPGARLQPFESQILQMETDLPFGLSIVAFRMPGHDSPDFFAARLLADVLHSPRAGLFSLAAEGKALQSGFEVADTFPLAGMAFAFAAWPSGSDGSSAASAVEEVIAGYVKNGVPPDLVEAAKLREEAQLELAKTSILGLAELWSQATAVDGRWSPAEELQALRKVSVADVDRAARTCLGGSSVVAILTPRASGAPVVSQPVKGKESFAPRQAAPVALPTWAEQAVRRVQPPKWELSPHDIHLANGVRLVILPERISRTVSIFGAVKTQPDLQVPKGQDGIDSIMESLFSYGTDTLDRLSFQKELDKIAAVVSAGSIFSLKVPSEHFERGLQLLADNLLHPGFPEAAFRIVQEQMAGTLVGLLQSPEYRAARAMEADLYPAGDPSLREARPPTVRSLTLRDVTEYHRRTFRPDLTTIVVVGDVEQAEVLAAVKRYFGEWRNQGPKPATTLPAVPLNKPSVAHVPDVSRVQDEVALMENLGITRRSPDYYALKVGNAVLGGSFYFARLYKDLREETGLVYHVETDLQAEKRRASYAIRFGCSPVNVSITRDIVLRDLRGLGTDPIPADELQGVKAFLLRRIPLEQSSVDEIGSGFVQRSLAGLPLDESFRAGNRYFRMTADRVRLAFHRWIRPDDFVQVSTGPEPN